MLAIGPYRLEDVGDGLSTHARAHACTRIAHERRHETSVAWREIRARAGESLDARCSNGMAEWKLARVYSSFLT